MPYRSLLLLLLLCSLVLQAESCWYPGPGGLRGDGEDDGNAKENPEGRCTELRGNSLPSLAFIPRHGGLFIDGPLWVVDPVDPQGLLAFDADELPPTSYVPSRDITIPDDSDGDLVVETEPLFIERLRIESLSLGLITGWGYDEVLFFNPSDIDVDDVDRGLARYAVSVPGGDVFLPTDYPNLPTPGDAPEDRTAVSTKGCVRAVGRKLSDESDLPGIGGVECDGAGSFYSERTTGATVINDRLFVSLNNLASVLNPAIPVYRPGTVLVFKFSGVGVSPVDPAEIPSRPSVVLTEGYNPADVIAYTTPGGRPFVLVVVNGAAGNILGEFFEVPGASASIEVIDAETLGLVGVYPLGNAALFGASALDPVNGVLVVGSAIDRWLFSVDLEPLSAPDFPNVATPVDLSAWVRHDRANPFGNPPRAEETVIGSCPGSIRGMAISDDLSEIYAVDYCSGELLIVGADADGTLTEALRSPVELTYAIDEPVVPPDPGSETDEVKLKGPGAIAVRPGTPGRSYEGSDLFFHASQPEGRVCAQEVFGK